MKRVFTAKSGRIYEQYSNIIQVYSPDPERNFMFSVRVPTFEEAEQIMRDLAGEIDPAVEETP